MLVITIVILIILSTVTISAVFGDGGLIEQSKQTHSDATNMMYSREENMNKLMQEYSNMMDEEEGIENPNLNDIENPNQNEIVDPGTEPDEPTLPEGWDGNKVEAVESEDGATVPVPIGYTASKASNENTVIGGFVIYEGEEIVTDSNVDSAKTSRNQFVWVPVQIEFNEMIESVDTYGGFYIGRYETGDLVATAGREPVVVKGNSSISNVNWYYMYRNIKELAANNNVKSTMIWQEMYMIGLSKQIVIVAVR